MENQIPEEPKTSEPQEAKQTEQQVIDQLFKEVDSYKSTNTQNRSDINDIYSAYMGRMDEVKKTPYFEPVSVPRLRTEVSYIVPFIFSGNPEIEIEPMGEEDKVISQILEKIVNFRLQTIPQAYEKIEAWVKQAVTFGTSLIKINWKFEMETDEMGMAKPITDEPELEVPHILDCFYNPILPDVESQNSIIFRSVVPIEEIKENTAYDYTNKFGQLNRENIESGTISANIYDSTRGASSDSIILAKASEGVVEVYERITCDRIQTISAGSERKVLRDRAWDYGMINAVKLVHEPNAIPNRFDGFGVGQNTIGIGKGLHSVDNQIKTNVALGNNPHFMGKKGANIDKKQLVVRSGGFTEVDGDLPLNQSIQPLPFNDVKQGALEWRNSLMDEHRRASGANDLVQGAASNATLGQDQIASTYSSNRFELIARRFKQALSDVAYIIIKMELKNLQSPEADILRIFPMGIRQQVYQLLISEDAQNCKYNIRIKGDTTIAKNKDIQIKQMIEAYNIFGAILPPENQMAWARKILELRGVDELDSLVPEPQQYAQQMKQQQMMAQGMGGQPGMQGIPMEQGAMNPQQMPNMEGLTPQTPTAY